MGIRAPVVAPKADDLRMYFTAGRSRFGVPEEKTITQIENTE